MTYYEAIKLAQDNRQSAFDDEAMFKWLVRFEGQIAIEILGTTFTEPQDGDTALAVPVPYDEVYVRYLEAMIDFANGEYGKYQNSMQAVNECVDAYKAYVIRTATPTHHHIDCM